MLQLLNCRYIGRTKLRYTGIESAFGWCLPDQSWSVEFPKALLMQWFGKAEQPGEAATLYNVLGITSTADEAEVKKAYRRMSKQWHPDICKEPGAHEQFMAIKEAYEILGDTNMRAKYNAGLMLEQSLRQQRGLFAADTEGYRTPLRCGLILVDAERAGRKLLVRQILQWEDIQDSYGRVMVPSWPRGADHFVESWVGL